MFPFLVKHNDRQSVVFGAVDGLLQAISHPDGKPGPLHCCRCESCQPGCIWNAFLPWTCQTCLVQDAQKKVELDQGEMLSGLCEGETCDRYLVPVLQKL